MNIWIDQLSQFARDSRSSEAPWVYGSKKPTIKKLRAKNAHGKTRGKPTLIEHLGEGESSVWGISDGFLLGAMFWNHHIHLSFPLKYAYVGP